MMSIYIISILITITIIFLYIAFVQYIKMKKYRKLYNVIFDEINEIESSIKSILYTVKSIDESGAFQSDDETGAVFDAIKTIIYEHFDKEELNDRKEKEEK